MTRLIFLYPCARADSFLEALRRLAAAIPEPADVVVAAGCELPIVPDMPKLRLHMADPDASAGGVAATNRAYAYAVKHLSVQPDDMIGYWSDDFFPELGAIAHLLRAAESNSQVAVFQPDDGIQGGAPSSATIPFIRAWWLEHKNNGHFWPPVYLRLACDTEILKRASMSEELLVVMEAKIKHVHWINGGRPRDHVDLNSHAFHDSDVAMFRARQKLGFPVVWDHPTELPYAYSTAIFGSKDRYWATVYPVLYMFLSIFTPRYRMVIHHDAEASRHPMWEFLSRCRDAGLLRLVPCDSAPLTKAMLWRMRPLWEQYSYVFCRDIDSLPSVKERKCMEAFIESALAAHSIKDHPCHCGPAFMGGMIGFNCSRFRSLVNLSSWESMASRRPVNQWSDHGYDQIFLTEVIAPSFSGHTVEHVFQGGPVNAHNPPADAGLVASRMTRGVSSKISSFSDTHVRHIGTVAGEYVNLRSAIETLRLISPAVVTTALEGLLEESAESKRFVMTKSETVPIY